MNKKYIFPVALGVAALATPLTAVAYQSNSSKNSMVHQVDKDSVWNPTTPLNQTTSFVTQDIKNYGDYTAWVTKTIFDGAAIKAIAPNTKGGLVVGGADGKFDFVDANGELEKSLILLGGKTINSIIAVSDGFLVTGADGAFDYVDFNGDTKLTSMKNLLGKKNVNVIIPDGQGNFLVGGADGMFNHIDSQGDVLVNWTNKTLLGGKEIKTIVSDGNGGFFVGGDAGTLDHLNSSLNVTTRSVLLGGEDINAIATDGKGNFLVGGKSGQLDKIDATGKPSSSWVTKSLFGNKDITMIFSNGNGGFFATSAYGQLIQLDANGDVITGSENTLLAGKKANAISADVNGGFFIGGEEGKLDYINADGLRLKFNSWTINQNRANAKYSIYKDMLEKDWSTSTTNLGFAVSSVIPTPPDANGSFYVLSSENWEHKVHRIKNDGTEDTSFTPISLSFPDPAKFAKAVSDGNGGFVAVGNHSAVWKGPNPTRVSVIHVDAQGKSVDLTSKTTNTKWTQASSVTQDGGGGYWVSGAYFYHIDGEGNAVNGSSNGTIGAYYVEDTLPDGKGGIFIISDDGNFEHYNAQGNQLASYSGGSGDYKKITYDNQGGFFIGNSSGLLTHSQDNGNPVSGWSNLTLLGGKNISSIVPDGSGGFLVGGDSGKLDRINSQGDIVTGWTTKTLLGGDDIVSIIPDGQGEFLVVGATGKIDHIDADGNSTKTETQDETLKRWRSHLQIVPPLEDKDFAFTNNAGNISVNYTKHLTNAVILEYSDDNGVTWKPSVDQLHNGQAVLVHQKLVNKFEEDYYQIENDLVLSVMVDAPLIKINDQISQKDFAFSDDSDGKIDVALTKQLSPLLKVVYSSDGTKWSDTLPTNLKYGDKVESKLDFASASSSRDYDLVNASVVKLEVVKPAAKFPIWGWILLAISGAFLFVGLALLLKKFALSPRLA